MKNSKLVVSIIGVTIVAFVYSSACAKQIYPAEILGRDLNYPGLGWAGHVGIATTNMGSAKGMSLIKELHDTNDSDLDSYLFGPLSLAYESVGKNLLEPKSRQTVVNYLKEVQYKYMPSNRIKASLNDPHRSTTLLTILI